MPRTLLVRSLISNLRSRWDRFCVNIRGVFRLCIASSSNTGVWVESLVKAPDVEPAGHPGVAGYSGVSSSGMSGVSGSGVSANGGAGSAVILHSSDSLLSNRMCMTPAQGGVADVGAAGGAEA